MPTRLAWEMGHDALHVGGLRRRQAAPVMMTPSPNSSYCGRPARPNICITSSGDSSPHAPTSGLYTCRIRSHECVALLESRTRTQQRSFTWQDPGINGMSYMQHVLLHNRISSSSTTGSAAAALRQASSGWLACVPLMMTLCAGRLTPQASVAVDTSTCDATGLASAALPADS